MLPPRYNHFQLALKRKIWNVNDIGESVVLPIHSNKKFQGLGDSLLWNVCQYVSDTSNSIDGVIGLGRVDDASDHIKGVVGSAPPPGPHIEAASR